jgi:CRISPR-associated protein Cmr2
MKVTGEERERWVPSSKDGFDRHPLVGVKTKVGLVYGGATKIKGYVFESAKLPEIRGASALFDRINLLDLPALWGRQPGQEEWENKLTEAQQRYEAVRRSFDPDAPLAPECIVYANGGNVLAFAPVSLLERLTTEIEHIYNDQTLVGQSAAVGGQFSLLELQYGMCPQEYWIEEYTADLQDEKASLLLGAYYGRSGDSETATFLRKKTFGELVTWLSNEQNRRREERQSIPHFETMPHVRRCFSCDRRGAVAKRVVDGVENYYCEPCARKLIFGLLTKRQEPEAVEDAKKWWREQGFTWRPLAARSWIDVFDQYLAESHQGEGYYKGQEPRVPKDLEDIAETAKPDGYIGVLYGDGNGVGTYIERITTPAQYRQFASRLYQAVQTSVFEAMRVHLLPTQDIYPFEILNIGGDDVFLIVPANKALPVAHAVAQKVEALLGTKVEPAREKMVPANERYALPDANGQPQRVVEAYKPQITLSAGVVIADAKTPIFMLKGLVDELLKEAKRWRKTRVYDGGMVDFLTLKATSMIVSGVKEFRKSALYQEGKERLWFTARPYTLHELQGLLQTVREFKQQEFPRSQLYALRRMIFGGKRLASTIDYLYFRLRLKEQPAKVIGLHFDRAWHRQPEVLPPWQRREKLDEYETVLPDIVELYDFVEKEEG